MTDIAVARAHFKEDLCSEGIGIFCQGADVDKGGHFLAQVMRAVARRLSHERWGVDGADKWIDGHPWLYASATQSSGATDTASTTTSSYVSAPSLRREIEAALEPAPIGKLRGQKKPAAGEAE